MAYKMENCIIYTYCSLLQSNKLIMKNKFSRKVNLKKRTKSSASLSHEMIGFEVVRSTRDFYPMNNFVPGDVYTIQLFNPYSAGTESRTSLPATSRTVGVLCSLNKVFSLFDQHSS